MVAFANSVSPCQLVTHSHSALGDRKFPRGPQALTQQAETVTVLAKGQNVPEREEAEEPGGGRLPPPPGGAAQACVFADSWRRPEAPLVFTLRQKLVANVRVWGVPWA